MAWRDDLPRIKAENAEWREKYLPALREAERERAARRDRVTNLMGEGLKGISDADRADVFAVTGIAL